jgi:diguanylate cyclase (GGDEF)-like protein
MRQATPYCVSWLGLEEVDARRRPGGPLWGEEFVVLLNGGLQEIEEVMERIRLKVEDRCSPVDGNPVHRQVTVSAGVASLTDDIQTLEELIEAADEAMYRAKRAGKNRVAGAAEEAA